MVSAILLWFSVTVSAYTTGRVNGQVRDQTGAVLPDVAIDLVVNSRELTTTTDDRGAYRFDVVPTGNAELTFRLLNFTVQRDLRTMERHRFWLLTQNCCSWATPEPPNPVAQAAA